MDKELAQKSSVLLSAERQSKEELLKTNRSNKQIEKELQSAKQALEDAQKRENQVNSLSFKEILIRFIAMGIDEFICLQMP